MTAREVVPHPKNAYCIRTLSGRLIDVRNPNPSSFKLDDICTSLSRIVRFAGHTRFTSYNVADHCIRVAERVRSRFPQRTPPSARLILLALLHDAHEMVTTDIPKPVKLWLGDSLRVLQIHLDHAVYSAFRIAPPTESEERLIKECEVEVFNEEWGSLMKIRGLTPGIFQYPRTEKQAKQVYKNRLRYWLRRLPVTLRDV